MSSHDQLVEVALRTIERCWESGWPVAGSTPERRRELAALVVARLTSRTAPAAGDRLRVLTKHLIARCEADPSLVGPLKRDYESMVVELLRDLAPHLDA